MKPAVASGWWMFHSRPPITSETPSTPGKLCRARCSSGTRYRSSQAPSSFTFSSSRVRIPILRLRLPLTLSVDSLVSSQVYEVIKTIYTSPDSAESETTRVSVLQNTLGQLRLANIATLDAITTHFTRLIELTSADEGYVAALAQALAPCVLRPRTESSLTQHERHAYRLVRDLFQHKEAIFGELKRASSALAHRGPSSGSQHATASSPQSPPGTGAGRDRAISSTESNRRAHMEERQRAIASRSRASSPAPPTNGRGGGGSTAHHPGPLHRRERSVGGAETRFPVVSSPPGDGSRTHHPRVRHSLEVPDSAPSTPRAADATVGANGSDGAASVTNGVSATDHGGSAAGTDGEAGVAGASGVEKKNSLGRSGHVAAAAGRLNRNSAGTGASTGGRLDRGARNSAGSLDGGAGAALAAAQVRRQGSVEEKAAEGRGHGVELADKPMDF